MLKVSSKFGVNAGHDNLPGVGYPEYSKRDLYLQRAFGMESIRVPMSDPYYAPGVNQTKQYAVDALAVGYPIVIWGVNKKSNKWKSSEWADLRLKIIAAYEWAQQNGITHFQIGNESDAYWATLNETISEATRTAMSGQIIVKTGTIAHGFSVGESVILGGLSPILSGAFSFTVASVDDPYTFTVNVTQYQGGQAGTVTGAGHVQPNLSIVVNRYKALATELKALPGTQLPIVYSVCQGNLGNWGGGKGPIDVLALNVYGEGSTPEARFDYFKAQIDQLKALNNTPVWVTEWGLHASYSSYPTEYDEAKYWFKKRYQYLEANVDKYFFHCWRSNSTSGSRNENHSMKLTWDKSLKGPYNVTDLRWIETFLS